MQDSERSKRTGTEPVVVEVVPILRGLPKPTLSYFYRGQIEEGEFVQIEVRNTPTLGIVSKISHARALKTDLKSAGFSLRKLTKSLPGLGLSAPFVRAAEAAAKYYVETPGKVLASLVPKLFLGEPELMTFHFPNPPRKTAEPSVIQAERGERLSAYQALIRESFAKKSSVALIVPTAEEAKRVYAELSAGIEEYTCLFLPGIKRTLKALEGAKNSKHPVLLVTLPTGLIFDRADLDLIILEHESARAYRTRKQPLISYRTFALMYAKESGKRLVLGDTVLSLETLEALKRGVFAEGSPVNWRLASLAPAELVDMKAEKDADKEFKIFSPELLELLRTAQEEGQSVFLFGARKGLSPTTVCGDCGTVLPCENCGAPVVLHQKKNSEERIYICHACGAQRSPETRCGHCGSWKLVPLGIGVDRIAAEVQKLFPKAPIFIFDKDTLDTASKARALTQKIAATRGALVVGTELYLSYGAPVDYAGIVTLDSLFAVPDFGIHERIFSLVTRVRENTRGGVIIQTRNIGKKILELAKSGNVADFYRSEISERDAFSYPPVTIFIKVRKQGEDNELTETAVRLGHAFRAWRPEFLKERRGASITLSMILRLPRASWPEPELAGALALLDPAFSITVDPETII